jgi:hypothetical protein
MQFIDYMSNDITIPGYIQAISSIKLLLQIIIFSYFIRVIRTLSKPYLIESKRKNLIFIAVIAFFSVELLAVRIFNSVFVPGGKVWNESGGDCWAYQDKLRFK